jgi:D-alanine-D-alanine ligase
MAKTKLQQYHYWVLAPLVQTNDANLDYYYDFTQSIEEYTRVFAALKCTWKWQPVTTNNYKDIIKTIATVSGKLLPFIINLCDGDDVNGVPGVAVIHELEKYELPYTGASDYFYDITTSKIPMKEAFNQHDVPTANWKVIKKNTKNSFAELKPPLLIKPAVSGGSMGVSVKNVIYTQQELDTRVKELKEGYRGWNLMVDGLFVEEFITGEEYTTFIIGNYENPDGCIVYEPIYRKFHESLPKQEQFLSFDRLWEIYEEEDAMPNGDNFYEYLKVDSKSLVAQLKKLTIEAYKACKGVGYARLDFRRDEITGKLYCLEVNAQCGLSEDENYTSIGAILRVSNKSFTSVIKNIIEEALIRVIERTKVPV